MDLAQLTLGVDSSQLKAGKTEMNAFGKEADNTAAKADKFNDAAEKANTATGKLAEKVKGALNPFGALGTVIGGISLGVLATMADTWSDVSSRVGLAIGDMDGAADAMDRLSTTARLTYSSLNQIAEGFVRNSLVLKELGKSTEDQLKYTEALNLALVASGAKGQQALLVQESLSRSMSMGAMRGQELNNVLNYSGEVAEALADEMGTTIGGLRQFAQEGKITAEVIYNTLTNRLEYFTERAASMPATLGDGFLLIGNSLTMLVGKFDQLGGVSETVAEYLVGLADGIKWVADNAEMLLGYVEPLFPVLLLTFGPVILGHVLALSAAIAGPLVKAVGALGLAVLANPMVAFGLAMATIISYTIDWETALQRVIYAFGVIMATIGDLTGNMAWMEKGLQIAVNAEQAVADLKAAAEEVKNTLTGGVNAGGATAGKMLEESVARGGASAAARIASAQSAAVARYEQMNGKAVKELGSTLIEGGKYIYNQASGEVKAAGKSAASDINKGVVEGGKEAASNIGQSMVSAGQAAGESFEAAGVRLTGSIISAFATELKSLVILQMQLIDAQIAKLNAEAYAIRKEARDGGGGSRNFNGRDGSGRGREIRIVEDYGEGWDPYRGRLLPGETAPADPADPAPPPGHRDSMPNITNVLSPDNMLNVLDTSAGHRQLINVIKYNRDEIANLLGST